jgi:hypothetical protein
VNSDHATTNLPVKIRKTRLTVAITTKTAINGQNVPRISTSIRRQNIVKTSALQVVRNPVKFPSAGSAKRKVRYCNLTVTRIPCAEMARSCHSPVEQIRISTSYLALANKGPANLFAKIRRILQTAIIT